MTTKETKEDRIDRGLAIWRERRDEIRPLGNGRWSVPGSGESRCLVDLEARNCDCGDYRFNLAPAGGGERCKHGWAAVFELMASVTHLHCICRDLQQDSTYV